MPIYEYKCEKCDLTVDINKMMSESSRKEFCTCGKELRRVLTPLGIGFNPLARRSDVELKTTSQEEGIEIFKKNVKDREQKQAKENFKKMVQSQKITI